MTQVGTTYELIVAGSLGPVLCGAFPASCVATVATTTFTVAESTGRSLADVIALVEEAGVRVQAIHRLRSPAPSRGSPDADEADRPPPA